MSLGAENEGIMLTRHGWIVALLLWSLGAAAAYGQEGGAPPAPGLVPQPEITKLAPAAKPQGWLPEGGKLDLALPADQRPNRPLWLNPQLYSFQTTLYRQGPHEVTVEGASSQLVLRSPYGLPERQNSLDASLTYRYKGLLGGVVRPVARLSSGSGHFATPGVAGLGGAMGRYSYVAPEVGLEIVYKGVGLGMTLGYPIATSQAQRLSITPGGSQPRLPLPAKRGHKKGFDWDRLFDQMSKNVYIVIEKPEAAKP